MNKNITTSPSGALTTYMFDASGDLASVAWAVGYVSTYTYNTNKLLVKEEIPSGTTMSVAYTTLTAAGIWLKTMSDDPLGKRTTVAYDSSGNLTTLTQANGAISTYGYATPSNHLRTRSTDPLGHTIPLGVWRFL
ncbi:MAG: RHS repeat domain-containing protein [Fimbriimonadaceae bacterium]